jgi:hypothetical protein
MTETRVFTKEKQIEIIEKKDFAVYNMFDTVSKFNIISKRIIPNTKFDIDTDCSIKNIYGIEFVNIKFEKCLSSRYFIEKDIIQKISRKFIKPHIEIKYFSSIDDTNAFLKEHSELSLENTRVESSVNGVLLIYEIEGDKNIKYLG